MKKTIVTLCAVFCTASWTAIVSAQGSDNIQSFSHLVNVRAFMGLTALNVDFTTDYTPSSEKVSYRPNPGSGKYYGVGLSWEGIGISFTGDIRPDDSDRKKYGDSTYENISVFLYLRNLSIDIFYKRNKGLYLSNPEAFGLHAGDPETIRPDLSLASLGVQACFVFSDDFSMIGAFNQTERQLESGGSIFLMASLLRYTVDAGGPLVPAAYDGGKYAGFYGGRFYSVSAGPGYAYTFIYMELYLTLGAFLGLDIVYQQMDVASGEKSCFTAMLRSGIKSAMGYNGESYFAGVLAAYDAVTGVMGELTADRKTFNLEFFAGTRL